MNRGVKYLVQHLESTESPNGRFSDNHATLLYTAKDSVRASRLAVEKLLNSFPMRTTTFSVVSGHSCRGCEMRRRSSMEYKATYRPDNRREARLQTSGRPYGCGDLSRQVSSGESWIELSCIHAKLARDCRRSIGILQ